MPLPSAGPQPVFGTRLLRRLGLPAVAVKPRTSRRLRSCPKSPTLPARQLPRAKPAGTRGSTSPLPSPLLTYRCAVSGGGGGEAEPRPRGGAARPAAAGARGSCAAPPRPAAPGGGGEQRCGAPARRGAPESAVPAGRPSSAACERRSSRGSCAPQPQSGDLRLQSCRGGEARLSFVFTFCARTESAVTPEAAPPAATMVAKDYPFYLSVKRANCALEVQTVTSPAKETEVPSLLVIRLHLCFSL